MSGEELVQTLFSGLSLGGTYAIVALGFVIVFSATKVLSFLQAGAVMAGGYLTYSFGSAGLGLPFALAVLLAAVCCAAGMWLAGEVVIGSLVRKDRIDAASIATIGLYFIIVAVISAAYGADPLNLGDPWGLDTVSVLGASVTVSSIWTIAVSALLATAWFLLMQRTTVGLATRAMVIDREAAEAQGVRPRRITGLAWSVAGGAGAIAGALLATGSGGVNGTLGTVPFLVLPAIVLGGLRSPLGAVVGGMLVGVLQQFVALLQPVYFEDLGSRIASVSPFILLVLVLLVRPNGLFGARSIERF